MVNNPKPKAQLQLSSLKYVLLAKSQLLFIVNFLSIQCMCKTDFLDLKYPYPQ